MPINVLEQHPCLDYYKEIRKEPTYTSLIIGGFPNEGSTNKFDANLNITDSQIDSKKVFMKFFYGSNDGVDKLNWDYLFETFTEKNFFEDSNPEGNKKAAISFLEKNNLLMSDVIETTNRHDKFKKNDDLKNIISKNPEIILYFTAKYDLKDTYNIFSIFCKIFDGEISIKNKKAVGKKVWALEIEIHKKTIKVFFLPTIRGTRVDNLKYSQYLRQSSFKIKKHLVVFYS